MERIYADNGYFFIFTKLDAKKLSIPDWVGLFQNDKLRYVITIYT
jgi:hypothetical protein